MELRKLEKEHIDEIARLIHGYWKERGAPEKFDLDWTKDYLVQGHKKEIEEDSFFICKHQDRVVGVVALVVDVDGIGEVRDMVLKKEWRGKGLGKEVLEEVISLARKKGLRKLLVKSVPGTEKFYSSFGFEKEGTLKGYFRDGEDISLMTLSL